MRIECCDRGGAGFQPALESWDTNSHPSSFMFINVHSRSFTLLHNHQSIASTAGLWRNESPRGCQERSPAQCEYSRRLTLSHSSDSFTASCAPANPGASATRPQRFALQASTHTELAASYTRASFSSLSFSSTLAPLPFSSILSSSFNSILFHSTPLTMNKGLTLRQVASSLSPSSFMFINVHSRSLTLPTNPPRTQDKP